MNRGRSTVGALALGLLLQVGVVRAQEPDSGVEVTAAVPVLSDAARAREQAIKEAMQHAVEQVVQQAAPEARGRLYLISARARDYVLTYRMLEEGESAGQFRVRMSAQVDLPRLLSDLQVQGSTRRRKKPPALLLCTGEGELRAALLPSLSSLSWEVLPASGCPQGAEASAAMNDVLKGSAAQAALFVDTAPVPGATTMTIRGTQPTLYGAQARGHAVLYGPGGKRFEEEREATGFGEGPEAAVQAAQKKAALQVLSQLLPRLGPSPADGGDGVLCTLEGIASYGDYQRLWKTLSAMPGVKRAEPRRFSAGSASVLLVTDGNGAAPQLGAALGRTPVPGLRLQVVPEGPDRLRVLVAAESALPAPPPPSLDERPSVP